MRVYSIERAAELLDMKHTTLRDRIKMFSNFIETKTEGGKITIEEDALGLLLEIKSRRSMGETYEEIKDDIINGIIKRYIRN